MGAPVGRRRLLLAAAGAVGGLAGCSARSVNDPPWATGDASLSIDEVPATVGLETVVGGLDAPVSVAFAPNAERRYLAERDGRILVHGSDGRGDEPFLDLRDSVVTGGERGLLGIALHPDFAENRRFFVRYSAPVRPGTPEEYSHTFVLAEFEADEDGRTGRAGTERTILEIPQPRDYHNAGDLAFGPDEYLYVPVGDSGGTPGTGWYDAVEGGGDGQDVTENFLGSLLCIDVDTGNGADGRPYGIPEDNPLVGRDGLDEYFAWGFRNPWRLSFDGDDLYVADVGQDRFEEVNLVEKGGNYGWIVKEGTHCYQVDDCPDRTPEDIRGGEPLIDPIIEYPHSGEAVSGSAVIGGHVHRSPEPAGLDGVYVFGDFLADGRLFAATPAEDGGLWPTAVIDIADGADRLGRLLSFGRDDGDVYALATGAAGGGLFRIVPAE